MFHNYIITSSKTRIDITRVRDRMDDELFEEAYRETIDALFSRRPTLVDISVAERMGFGARYKAQQTWNKYCRAHKERYGVPFEPDVNPEWDR